MKQKERIYMISDAAKNVGVESHVLRYWEEELGLPIKRNEMGHRYYTEEDIRQFQEIKELKEQGLQLKAIRNLLNREGRDVRERHILMVNKGEIVPLQENTELHKQETKEEKSLRLQKLLHHMIQDAVQVNNEELCQEIVNEVKESVLKELDYQFRLQEEREDTRDLKRLENQEEHFRKLDALIRTKKGGGSTFTMKELLRKKAAE